MQPSDRQRQLELERVYNQRLNRKGGGHTPTISISDDNHHVTEAIGSYYDDDDLMSTPSPKHDSRPLSFVSSPSESYEGPNNKRSKRNGSYFDQRQPLVRTTSNEKVPTPLDTGGGSRSPKRMSSLGSENAGAISNGGMPPSPPSLSRGNSHETAIQQFPLNDIDYESSPAAVAQELSNLQAIRRMSMNVDMADPDLPSFGGTVPTRAPDRDEDENDAARLFWVPARLHPELAPKEFKTFIEDRVDKIRRRSGEYGEDSLSPDGLGRSGSSGSGSSLRRKKSMLSRQINSHDHYEDGAERLERKRSKGVAVEGQTQVDLQELETLVNDPAQMMRRMSLDTARRSHDSGIEVPPSEDMPMLPPGGQSLKRSTRTAYRRGSLKKGERVPFSKRAQQRTAADDSDEPQSPITAAGEESMQGLMRVQTEPVRPSSAESSSSSSQAYPSRGEASLRWRETHGRSLAPEPPAAQSRSPTNDVPAEPRPSEDSLRPQSRDRESEEHASRPHHRQFQSRLASGTGRTTAQLPGYNNQNPLPQIVETLPDGTKVPSQHLVNQIPDRKSHEMPRPVQRGGAHMRPVPGREQQQHRSSTLDDISSRPSPLPGSGNTSTDALTMVPTFEQDARKAEKTGGGGRKSSWKWILGSDDEEKKATKEASDAASVKSGKSGKLTKAPADKARLDVLQSSIDNSQRGRESIVLNREDLKLDEERKKESKKSAEAKSDKKEKDSGLLSAIFGGKKKASDGDLKEKKRNKSDRNLSPDPTPKVLKPDIDYNWTRFSILEERAIYRMAHLKLANPRRALYSQVLLSNFMYSYLAKVQMMHPQVQVSGGSRQQQQQQQQQAKQAEQQAQQTQQPAEYSQYQRWQQQQQEHNAPNNGSPNLDMPNNGGAQRTSYEYEDDGSSSGGFEARSSGEYEYDHQHQQQHQHQHQQHSYQQHSPRPNGNSISSQGSSGGGYSVAGSHDYLGYPKDKKQFDGGNGLWDDEQREELW